jgi:hypothetical protein
LSRVLRNPELHFEERAGRWLMCIKFNDESSWMPAWKDIKKQYGAALMVERLNKIKTGKGDPEALLVNPIIHELEFLGYLGRSLFRFDIEAEVQNIGVTLEGQLYISSNNFEEAKKKAIRKFEDSMVERARDTKLFKDKLLSITRISVTEYIAKKSWEEPITKEIVF